MRRTPIDRGRLRLGLGLAIATCGVTVAGVLLVRREPAAPATPWVDSMPRPSAPAIASPIDVPGTGRRADAGSPPADPVGGTGDAGATARSRTHEVPWQWSDQPERTTDLPLLDVVRERYRVQLRRGRLVDLEVGDHIPLEIPGQGTLFARVESLMVSPFGDRCWRGHISDGQAYYPVIYTEGPQLTFATIITPQGPYALQATGDYGHLFRDNRDDLADPTRCQLIPKLD